MLPKTGDEAYRRRLLQQKAIPARVKASDGSVYRLARRDCQEYAASLLWWQYESHLCPLEADISIEHKICGLIDVAAVQSHTNCCWRIGHVGPKLLVCCLLRK